VEGVALVQLTALSIPLAAQLASTPVDGGWGQIPSKIPVSTRG
jgi:hypothetical protein